MGVIVYAMCTLCICLPLGQVKYKSNFQSARKSNTVEECCAEGSLVLFTTWPGPGLYPFTYKVRGPDSLLFQVPSHSPTYDSEEWVVAQSFHCKYKLQLHLMVLEQVGGTGSIYELFIGACCPIKYLEKYEIIYFFFPLVCNPFQLFLYRQKFPIVSFSNWHEKCFVFQSKYDYRFFPKWILTQSSHLFHHPFF